MKLEISHNSTSMFRGCPKKYYWNYIKGLKPKKKAQALTLGTAIHAAFEMYYSGVSDADVVSALMVKFDDDIANASMDEVENVEINKWTALGMWMNYPNKNLTAFQSIEPEKTFSVRFDGMRGVRFVGRVDGLIMDSKGRWWIREVKTTGLTPKQFRGRMNTSPQVTGYVYAMRRAGYPVEGVVFDMIKKPRLRKGVHENCTDFSQRIMEDYRLNPDKAYMQGYIYRNPDQIAMYEEDMKKLVQDIRLKYRTNGWNRNQDQCWNFNSLCPYERICFMNPIDKNTVDVYYDRE